MKALIDQLTETFGQARSREELVRPLLEMLELVTGLESTYLTRIDADAGVQEILYARNTGAMQIPEGLSVPWDDTLCKRALDEGRMYTDNVAECWGDSDAARALGIRTYLSTPVRAHAGELFGTLCAASSRSHEVSADGQRILAMFASLIGQAVEREQLIEKLREANAQLAATALTDVVTGLPNRRHLEMEAARLLARAARDGSCVLLAFIDLDDFKAVNDQHGHDAGDEFLLQIGLRIEACARGGDLVARLGGDEFVLAAPVPLDRVEEARVVLARRLEAGTAGRFQLDDVTLEYAGASVGIAVSCAKSTVASLLEEADAAMYAVKRERRARR